MAKNISTQPIVTVVMPVYNAQKFLKDSIEGILAQTLTDFEFIIIDDGSKDNSLKIIKSYKDPRIVIKSHANRGLSVSLNEGISMARGKYIARQDADDISAPERLAKQVEFMETNPGVSLLGSNYHCINGRKEITSTTNVFTKPDDLKIAEFASNQFGHGSVVIRKSVLAKTGLYNSNFLSACDVDLWNRISREGQIANLKEPLYLWRNVGEGLSTSQEGEGITQNEVAQIRLREVKYFMSHKSEFPLFSFHPFSTRGGIKKYFVMKNTMFRDVALLHCYMGQRRHAPVYMLLAIFFAPWLGKSYRQLATMLFKKMSVKDIPYEYI